MYNILCNCFFPFYTSNEKRLHQFVYVWKANLSAYQLITLQRRLGVNFCLSCFEFLFERLGGRCRNVSSCPFDPTCWWFRCSRRSWSSSTNWRCEELLSDDLTFMELFEILILFRNLCLGRASTAISKHQFHRLKHIPIKLILFCQFFRFLQLH